MMMVMDSSSGFPESPMEQDEAAYPCKGCGEVCFRPPCCLSAKPPPVLGWGANDGNHTQILEEGKAFELGMSYYYNDGHLTRSVH